LYSPRFEFKDGGQSPKLFVVLNDPTQTDPGLVLRTTSKDKGRRLGPGCFSKEGYYVVPAGHDWFRDTTWVLLEVYEYDFKRELTEHFKGNLETKSSLREETLRAIINCLKRTEDITSYHLTILAKSEKAVKVKTR
jgi:hypothetical protein